MSGTNGGRRLQNLLTATVGLIATAAQAQGMWNFFGDQFRISNYYLRGALFAFIELGILVSALRARRHRIDHGGVGVDGATVWVLALLSGILSATDTSTTGAALGRLAVPLVAAWMFERAISVERSDRVGVLNGIPWRITPARVLVWLRLADPAERDVADVARAHRLAQLARYAYRVDQVRPGRRKVRMQRRLVRRLLKVNADLHLATNPLVMAELRSNLATVFQALGQMTPVAVADLSPWGVAGTLVHGSVLLSGPFDGAPRLTLTTPLTEGFRSPGSTPGGTPPNGSGTAGRHPSEIGAGTPAGAVPKGSDTPWRNPTGTGGGTVTDTPRSGADTPVRNPGGTPARNGSATPPAPPLTSNGTPDGTGSDTPEEFPADAVLLPVLRDPARVSREPDGTVPVKRAMRVLGTGRDRAIRLLRKEGLLRETPAANGSDTPRGTGSVEGSDDDQERVPVNGHNHGLAVAGVSS